MTKVLVIEDDNFLLDAYSTKLQKVGFKVILATNGKEGLRQAQSQRPDIILLDLLLPKKNGFDVLADLKADPKLKSIPVVVLSNLGQEQDIVQVKQLGAVEYLIKANVSMAEIIVAIKRVVKKKGKLKLDKKFKPKKKFDAKKLFIEPEEVHKVHKVRKVHKVGEKPEEVHKVRKVKHKAKATEIEEPKLKHKKHHHKKLKDQDDFNA